MGGAGGPAGAAGGNEAVAAGGTEAVAAGGTTGGADCSGAAVGSGFPLETAVEVAGEAGGAGATEGTGSGRNAGVSPLPVSFEASTLAASALSSAAGVVTSGLLPSFVGASIPDNSFSGPPLGSSSLGG